MDKDITAQRRDGQRPWQKFGLSGSTLKLIAAACMLADHLAAGVLGRYIAMLGITQNADQMNCQQWEQWRAQTDVFVNVYESMRLAGRIAFPIYCFLLVEGFRHTQKRARHAAGLLVFALISEIPFDLCFYGEIISFRHQNVFFTLFIGVLAMSGMDWIETHLDSMIAKIMLDCAVTASCMFLAQAAAADYKAAGVLCIAVLYFLRDRKFLQALGGGISFFCFNGPASAVSFVPLLLYNGKRGWKAKYFFYWLYPLHLFVFYLIAVVMKIESYPMF